MADYLFQGSKFGSLEQKIKNEIKRKSNKSEKVEKVEKSKKKASSYKATSVRKISEIVHNQKKNRKSASQEKQNNGCNEGFSEENDKNEIYFEGIPFNCSEDDVRKFFEVSGEIEDLRLPTWHDSGKLKGYGHVTFKSKKSAKLALERNGEYLKDRYISMDWSKPLTDVKEDEGKKKKQVVGCRSIFVKNLPYDVTEEMIRKEFMVYGTIIKVRMVTWVHTGNFKGFVYIDYSREDSAQIAVNKSGSIFINGRRTIVDYNTDNQKAGYKEYDSKKKK